MVYWAKKNSLFKSGYLSLNVVSYLESYFGLIQLLFQNNGLVNENVQGYKAHGERYISRVTVYIQKLTLCIQCNSTLILL